MNLTTFIALFTVFATIVLGIYYIIPKKYRYLVLLIFSVVLYVVYGYLLQSTLGYFLPIFTLGCVLAMYFAGLGMNKLDEKFSKQKEGLEKEERKALKAKFKKKKKIILFFAILIILGFLIVLKYSGFITASFSSILSWFNVKTTQPAFIKYLLLPLGISYYTLSAIGYVVDVYRGKYQGERNFFKVALFIFYFPQLYEGPIAQYDKLAPQLYEGHDFDGKQVRKGLLRVFWGLFKYLVIANRFAIIADAVFKNYSNFNGLVIIVGIVSFTIQLYGEFSGIVDVATGISEMFGIKLAKNFEQPFFSQTVNEFWRRWHISLGTWFREYIFYPISMSKPFTKLNKKLHGKVNKFFEVFIPSAFALFAVWFLNGLWHGASAKYIVYGLYYYVIMMIGMCLEPLKKLVLEKMHINANHIGLKIYRIVRTLILVNIGMMLFRATSLSAGFDMFAQIFHGGNWLGNIMDGYDITWCVLGLVTLITVDTLKKFKIDVCEKICSSKWIYQTLIFAIIIITVLVFGAYGDGYVAPDPIYGAF